jgi:hypothetical protein
MRPAAAYGILAIRKKIQGTAFRSDGSPGTALDAAAANCCSIEPPETSLKTR